MKRVHVVTSCTDRKLVDVPESLRMGRVREARLGLRIRCWKERLAAHEGEALRARDLYGGEHWVQFMRLLDESRKGLSIQGWVISAGYGLIPVDSVIHPYAAAFSRYSSDSVRPKDALWAESDWWARLAEHEGLGDGDPRTLADLGRRFCGEPILITASDTYFRAIGADLAELIDSRPVGEVTVFGARLSLAVTRKCQSTVRYDSRLQAVFGGSKISLNIRALAYALGTARSTDTSTLSSVIEELMQEVPQAEYPKREASGDAEVREFIRQALELSPEARATPLLREWRGQNRACEQGRFRDLFGEIYEDLQVRMVLEESA